ncbi:MAG: 30S ribosomal protein S3 [Clostridia bacterium]|jgi:small subunit ribosomal protein S3|nr:30S ribosomal protein S3 [Clostridia bacterium]
MGQKINPNGMRIGINKDWLSRWFVDKKEIPALIVEDKKIRVFIKNQIRKAGISKIEIERRGGKIYIFVYCAKPGIVIGRAGSGIEKLKKECSNLINSQVIINVLEVKRADSNAQLVAENVAQQLEKRTPFRRAIKQVIGKAMRLGVKGIKVRVSGRLAGADIARAEHYHEGSIPLQMIRADIDYGFAEADTTYGKIGVKVWIYKGEIFKQSDKKIVKGGVRNAVA